MPRPSWPRAAGGELSTSRNASTAQALNSSLSGGVLSGLATIASGWLFDRTGAHGYLLMAAMSAASSSVRSGSTDAPPRP